MSQRRAASPRMRLLGFIWGAPRFREVFSAKLGGAWRIGASGGLLALAFGFGQAGCGVEILDDASAVSSRNSCEKASECGSGASCSQGVCAFESGGLDALLLSVTPGTTTREVGGIRFLIPADGLSLASRQLELPLTPPAVVKGRVTERGASGEELPSSCDVHVTFTPVARVLGLPPEEHTGTTQGARLEANIPAGSYEVYVQGAQDESASRCELAPWLHRRIEVGSGVFELPLAKQEPHQLDISFLAGELDLSGWYLVVLDSKTGRTLSREVQLSAELLSEGAYRAELYYNPVAGDPVSGQELIRLRPPAGLAAPTLVWKREGLEVFSPGKAAVDLSQVKFQLGSYTGFVDGPDRTQQAATLVFSSISLDGLSDGVLGAFTTTTTADESGAFVIESIPLGKYRVQVLPTEDSGLGAREVTVSVTAQGQGGGTILLEARPSLAGSVVFDQLGFPAVSGATVHAVASPRQVEYDAFRAALGERPFWPRASSGVTDQNGTFKLRADAGIFDISVRPPAGSYLPWLVRTQVEVPLIKAGLGQLQIEAPVLHSGSVSLRGSPIAGASVRAYAYVGASGYVSTQEKALSVVPVAEAYTDEAGRFVLALPSE